MRNALDEKWQQIAIEIGNNVYQTVNTPATVGTDDETGYILMFFNARHHYGKSTLIASDVDKASLKKLLKTALRGLNQARIVEPYGRAS